MLKRKKDTKITSRRDYIFNKLPMWKAIIITSIPSVLTMIFFGGYSFADSIISINFAADSYEDNISAQIIGLENFVRLAMTSTSPMNILILSFGLFFGLGISTRASINLGANKKKEAIKILKTGVQFSIIISLVLVLVLYFVSPLWIESQYPIKGFGDVSIVGYDYMKIFIISAPFMILSTVFSSLFIVEGRYKEMLIAMVGPILLNLFLDWVFMSPAKMGIEGGALATVLSNATSVFLFLFFMFIKKTDLLKISNFFGSFKFAIIIGILLIGLATFLRYFSLSIVQTTQFNIMKDISPHIYKEEINDNVNKIFQDYMNSKPTTINENFRAINGAYYSFINSDLIRQLKSININAINVKIDELKDSAIHINSKTINEVNENIQKLLSTKINSIIPSSLLESIKNPKIKSDLLSSFSKYSDKSIGNIVQEQLVIRMAKTHLSIYASGAFPILMLLFPSLFGFIQGTVPIMSYNFGAKKIDRVKKGYLWNIIYSLLFTIFIYFLGSFIIDDILFDILGISIKNREASKIILKIILSVIPLLSVGISGMVVLAATDRIMLSTIASSLNGIILFFPIQYIMKDIAIDYNEISWLYFLSNPIGAFLTSIIIIFIVWFVFGKIAKKHITLDERINKINFWIEKKFKKNQKKKII